MNFKEYVGEATAKDFKAQGYGGTSNKTKFQLGDYVVVTNSQTKRGEKYLYQHGKIIGYKPFQMVVKYAVEFPDGEADAYYGQMIAGPFKDEATAIKYSKQIKKLKSGSSFPQIAASDLRGYVDKPLDTNPKFEAFLKQLLTAEPFNMQWLDTPVQFSDGKYTISVLAIKPTNFKKYGVNDIRVITKLTSSSLQNYLRDNVCLLRQNNAVNGKLVTQNYIRGLPSFNASSPYFMTMMWLDVSRIRYHKNDYNARDINFFDKKELSSALKDIDKIDVHGVALPVSLVKKPNELITAFKAPYDVLSGNYDPKMIFELYYDVIENKGQKVITGRIRADETTLKYFENYTQHYEPGSYGNSELVIYTDQPDRLVIPPGMRKIVLVPKTGNTKLNIKDFSFIPPNAQELTVSEAVIQSLNGLPNVMEKLNIEHCELPSLHGLPKKIGTLEIESTNLKDFTGAEDTEVGNLMGWKNNFTSLKGVPKAKHYGLGERFSEKQIKKVIADREMVKRLDKDEQEAWGDIITSL
jgi:hypothetical protein